MARAAELTAVALHAPWSSRNALLGMRCNLGEATHAHANPDDITAQIDPMGVPWLMIGEELSAALNGG